MWFSGLVLGTDRIYFLIISAFSRREICTANTNTRDTRLYNFPDQKPNITSDHQLFHYFQPQKSHI